ncbi:site-specific integrase [Hymenobacter chitinivorans]|uniref:Site-specific recombinase XerD n=1 Tax=Hymenobacter chitinivorans DSM 11115 TaxID=1121954 RepID=A0A2M9BAF7_9BACT|nr:site-specific integrase [Hymenobacter chitinivorans]PJJ54928.1 site-specific recombinase XerD [Hymenobacter chitinivorans DSM 11115]
MASVKVLLMEEKINKAGEAPVYLRIIKDRKPKYISIGLRVKPQDWNSDLGRVKKSHPKMAHTNAYLSAKLAEADATALDMQRESKFVSPVQIKNTIMGQSSESFLKYFEKHLHTLEKTGKISSLTKAAAVFSKLKVFLGTSDLLFDEVTVSFLKQYEDYLHDELGNSVNTIHSNLKIFRKLINDAIREDLFSVARDPFRKFKLKLEKTTKSYLSEDELEALWTLPLKEGLKLWHHRNLFVFAAYAGGLRISDLLQLRWSNFSGTHIRITMQKTNDAVSVKVPNRALEILQLYRHDGGKPSDYIFPFLHTYVDYTDPRALHRVISSATAYANKNLKIIAERAGIEKHISFHSSRHTFATRALTKGVAIELVSKLMGHHSINTTQIYAKIVNEKLDQAMDAFN